jgi:hypothetical protein
LIQQCVKCQHIRKNKVVKEDDMDKVIQFCKNKIFTI